MAKKRTFELIHGNKRQSERKDFSPDSLKMGILSVDAQEVGAAKILSLSQDSVSLEAFDERNDIVSGRTYNVGLTVNKKAVLNGAWHVDSIRQEKGKKIIALNRGVQIDPGFLNFVNPELFLHTAHFRILTFQNESDVRSLETLFTEIKSCPIPVPVTIRNLSGAEPIYAAFSFEGSESELRELSFKAKVGSNIDPSLPLFIDFTFLTTRYLLKVLPKEIDTDFDLICTHLPSEVLFVSNRAFYRHESAKTVRCKIETQTFDARLKDVSVLGCCIKTSDLKNFSPSSLSGRKIEIKISDESQSVEVNGTILQVKNGDVHIRLEGEFLALHKFLIMALPDKYLIRHANNYDDFVKLYQLVGYLPSQDKDQSVTAQHIEAWSDLDGRIPGNTLGQMTSDEKLLMACVGVLPMSPSVVYGHSACMVKTMEAAFAFFKQMTYAMSFGEFLPGIQAFAGSFNYRSGFTTRLQVIFDLAPKPEEQIILHTRKAVFLGSGEVHQFKIKEASFSELSYFPPVIARFIKLLPSSHPSMVDLHSLAHFIVLDDSGEPAAWFIRSESKPYVTAVDIFNYSWLFTIGDTQRVKQITSCVADHLDLNNRRLYLVHNEGAHTLDAEDAGTSEGSFWAITPKENFGPVHSSMAFAVYKVLLKYGEAASASLFEII